MENLVPFKVFTFWTAAGKPEVRRFGVEKSLVTSFIYLNAKLQEIYPRLKNKTYFVTWKDEEGDDVTISSDEEVMTALASIREDIIKLYVQVKDEDLKNDDCEIYIASAVSDGPALAPGAKAIHYGVACDSCNTSVAGFRYKCTTCDDFDLCSKCEAAGMHPEHCMVRVPTPSMPRAFIKAAIKRSRQFLKTVITTSGEECPYKKNRCDRSAEKQGSDGEGRYRGDHHRRERHHRRPRSSWLDTFATYMNEFADLAGDIGTAQDSNLEPPKPEQCKSSEQQNANTGNTQAPNTQGPNIDAQKPGPSAAKACHEPEPSAPDMQCPFMPVEINKQNIQKILEMVMNGGVTMTKPSKSNDASVNTSSVPTNNASVNTNDVEMGNATDADQVSIKSDVSAGSSKRDESPDKAGDWTVINSEKDLMDTYMKATAPAEPTAPIGFNLPEEFQGRVRISEGQNIYPSLNTATAVLNPKAPETPKQATPAPQQATPPPQQATPPPQQATPPPQQATPPPQQATPPPQQATPPPQQATPPPRQAQQQTNPPPRPRHPMAHINAAIEQMLQMGFTNEGEWLTQLLENKDGNIAAVLDLLTPVTPKRK